MPTTNYQRPTTNELLSVLDYHDRTKHHFHRFSRSLGYLDWATQPNPFRRYAGAPVVPLARAPLAVGVPYERIYRHAPAAPLTSEMLAEFLRCSLGLSAWKQYGASRWALRVNPSSGNLHPTEGYVVTGLPDLSGVFHYAPAEHALEQRCGLALAGNTFGWADWSETFLVGLTSIHWREAWKYGERAFRYCQHDAGHAIAALRCAAALLGWRLAILPRWSDAQTAALLGLAEEEDEEGPERELPDCLAVVSRGAIDVYVRRDPAPLVDAARQATWHGTPNRLSPGRVEWPVINSVAGATEFPGAAVIAATNHRGTLLDDTRGALSDSRSAEAPSTHPNGSSQCLGASVARRGEGRLEARSIILQRRSALGFDGRSSLPKAAFVSMLQRLAPGAPPWDAVWWEPHLHLVFFVHRVDGVVPGIYAFLRDPGALAPLRAACRDEFLWEPVTDVERLFLLVPLDCRAIARRLSCDQDIAADGFFALAMLARFAEPLRSHGGWFYRNLFWESGMIGQVLYLEAEAAGARATGIGCYYDDPVHDLLGLSGHDWQSLYHFSAGMPVDDMRLTTEPGYAWER